MVDVGGKPRTRREAVASCSVLIGEKAVRLIKEGGLPKGDMPAVARLAGIMAAKKTSALIPLCHPLDITSVNVEVRLNEETGSVEIESTVRAEGPTGVEMEALTAAAVAALSVYDMCKAVSREAVISNLMLISKKGGKSGAFLRKQKGKAI